MLLLYPGELYRLLGASSLYFRRILRVAAKRKATEDISQRPSKVIRSVLCDIQEDHLQPKDLRSTSQAMYRERRKRHPSNPKSRNDVFEAVRGLSVKSSKGENLLQVIDSDHGFVIFTTMTNLNFLFSDISDIFMDGTFKCCPKYFEQLYTLHGFKNRHCTTDMSSTTRKVGKCVPNYVVSYY
jgi:hypothetical protein